MANATYHHVETSSMDDVSSIVDTFLATSTNIIAVALSQISDAHDVFAYAETTELVEAGRAWYFMQGGLRDHEVPVIPPASLPQGAIILNAVDAAPFNLTLFNDTVLQVLSPTTYPGTGPGADLYPNSINTFDAIMIYARAIEVATNGFTTALTRSTLNTTIAATTYEGYGGVTKFDAQGFRTEQGVSIYSVNANATITFVGYTLGDQIVMITDSIVYPGNTTALPDDEMDFILIPIIWSITSAAIPEIARPWTINCIKWITSLVNNNASNLPPKTRLAVTVHDDHGDALTAVNFALQAAPRSPVVLYGSFTVPITQIISSVALGYDIPLTSSSLTSSVFSSTELYPTFFRLSSEARFEAIAVVELAVKFGWTDFTLVSTTDSYGQSISSLTLNEAAKKDVNVLNHIMMDLEADDYDDVVQELIKLEARVVVIEISYESFIAFMTSVAKYNWRPVAAVMIDVLPFSYDMTQFSLGNGFPLDIWNGWVSIGSAAGIGPLYDEFLAASLLVPQDELPGVSVIAGLYAIDYDSITVISRSVKACKELGQDPRNGTQLLDMIKTFKGELTTGHVSFETDGDRYPSFDIRTIRVANQYTVFRWSNDTGFHQIPGKQMYWQDGTTNIPISTLPKKLVWLSWTSGAGITLATIAIIGMVMGGVFLLVFWWYRDSKIIKSATWQFLIVMIIGCIIGAGTTMVWMGRPHPWICALRIWLPPNAFLLILGPLMAKTWRLHRIFSLSHLKVQPITLATLIWIVSVLQAIQIIICIFWISLGTYKPRIIDDPTDPKQAFALCDTNSATRICAYITYSYIGLIILFGCYISFKVRKLPKDFNESRWIGRTLYNMCLFAVLILILGYALMKYPDVVTILICVGTLGISLGSMIIMMGPKIFTLWQKPESRLPTTQRESKSGSQGVTNSQDLHKTEYSSGSQKRHEYSVQTMHINGHTNHHERKFSKDYTSSSASSGKRSSTTTTSSSGGAGTGNSKRRR